MTLSSESSWNSEFADLPVTETPAWSSNMANLTDSLVTGVLEISNIKGKPATFTFGKSAFQSALSTLLPTTDKDAGASGFASAWEAGVLASTMLVEVGASVGPPGTPATTYGPVNSGGAPSPPVTVIDPASVTSAKSALKEAIKSLPLASTKLDAKFGGVFRAAFLGLTCSTQGWNALPYSPPGSVPVALPNLNAPTA